MFHDPKSLPTDDATGIFGINLQLHGMLCLSRTHCHDCLILASDVKHMLAVSNVSSSHTFSFVLVSSLVAVAWHRDPTGRLAPAEHDSNVRKTLHVPPTALELLPLVGLCIGSERVGPHSHRVLYVGPVSTAQHFSLSTVRLYDCTLSVSNSSCSSVELL